MLLDRDALVCLVHDQVETLLKKGCGGVSTAEFLSHFRLLQDMCHKWKPIEVSDTHIPALVVIPFSRWGVRQQMEKSDIGYAWGDDPEAGEIRDHQRETIPKEPYVLIDIEMEMLGYAPVGLERLWIDQSARGWYKDRHMFTISEGIALATHYPRRIDGRHSYEFAGSFYRPSFDPEYPAGPRNFSFEEMAAAYAAELSPAVTDNTYWQPRDRRMYLSRLNDGRLWLSFFNYRSRIEASWAFPLCKMRIDPCRY